MTANQQAFSLYIQYKTTTPAYKALAAQLGYASSGDLNAVFCRRLNDKRDAKRLALISKLNGA